MQSTVNDPKINAINDPSQHLNHTLNAINEGGLYFKEISSICRIDCNEYGDSDTPPTDYFYSILMLRKGVVKDMDPYLDEGMGDVIVGGPFCKASCVEARRFDGIITIRDGMIM
ncbi:hypothetical protein Tco_1146412 [Tanacetum coccineum]